MIIHESCVTLWKGFCSTALLRRPHMDANGLDQEQQALLASIMGKSPQAGGGAAFTASQVSPAPVTAAPAASAPADPGRMLSQEEIDALIASMA